jgi:hypothetical protein
MRQFGTHRNLVRLGVLTFWAGSLSLPFSRRDVILNLGYVTAEVNKMMTVLGKELINDNNVNVLLSNYGSGYTPYVAKAGEDLGRVVLGPGCFCYHECESTLIVVVCVFLLRCRKIACFLLLPTILSNTVF